MPTKKSVVWIVERSDWFGECGAVDNFHTKAEAVAFARQCQKQADAVDDPEDKVSYTVSREVWEREA